MDNKFILIATIAFIGTQLHAQTYNYGLDICGHDAKIEGKLSISDTGESVYIGANAGINDPGTTMKGNIGIGYLAAENLTTGTYNVVLGAYAGQTSDYDKNVLIGAHAGKGSVLNENVMIGHSAGSEGTLDKNVILGAEAGKKAGLQNVYAGYAAGTKNTGQWNTFYGHSAGREAVAGNRNTYLGANSGQKSLGNENTFIGKSAGYDNQGSKNVMVGVIAGENTTGSRNVIVGNYAGAYGNAVAGNILLGFNAGRIFSGSNELYIENTSSNTPLIHGNFATDEVTFNGGTNVTGNITFGTLCNPSDIRFKEKIKTIPNALSDLLKVQTIEHEWRHQEFPNREWKQGKEYGVIAQNIEKIFPTLVFKDKNGYRTVDYVKLTPILIEAVNTQLDLISDQSIELLKLQAEIAEMQSVYESLDELERLLADKKRSKKLSSESDQQ